jgi:hypothetical protein
MLIDRGRLASLSFEMVISQRQMEKKKKSFITARVDITVLAVGYEKSRHRSSLIHSKGS